MDMRMRFAARSRAAAGIGAFLIALAAPLAFGADVALSSARREAMDAGPAGSRKPSASPAAIGTLPGVVCQIKVLSDKVPDVSSMDAWKKSFIRDGMTDEEKAKACWQSVFTFQYQDNPPCEFLQNENGVLDAVKMFNVYGYSNCGFAAAHQLSLARYAGLKGRGWTINCHVVSELNWDDAYHLMDSSLICYFPKPDGKVAAVEEIVAGVKEWYGKNPEYYDGKKGIGEKLRKLHAENGWTGWKTKGPEILLKCPTYDASGWLPAKTHGWYSAMEEYDGSTLFPYELGYSQGYRVNVQLRKGERLTRNWGNKRLHVNMDGGGAPDCFDHKEGFLKNYTFRYGDLANGRVGNGTLEYDVPLASGEFAGGALAAENVACKSDDNAGPALHVKDASKDGVLVIRMPSPYVYLGGRLDFRAAVGEKGGIQVGLSDNNGLDWKEIAKVAAPGDTTVDLKPFVYRRYDYRLKFTMKGNGTGLDSLKVSHDIQHSQRPLPALAQGENTISFSSGTEGTITIEGSTTPANKAKQLVASDFHPTANSVDVSGLPKVSGAKGDLTFAVDTPGDMIRLRFGLFGRVHDKKDKWDLQASFDDGKSFKTVDTMQGPARFAAKYAVVEEVPKGTRKALVRYAGENVSGGTMVFDFRIDADYAEPKAGFWPVKVTYAWEENGQQKTDVHVAKSAAETYTIKCDAKPTMKSLVVELAE